MTGRKEPRLRQVCLSLPKLRGRDDLARMVEEYGGEAAVCRDFHLSPSLLSEYLSGVIEEPPRTLLLALYWHTPMGMRQAYAEAHWTHCAMVSRAHLAEARLLQHQLLLQAVAPQVQGMAVIAKTYGIEDAWLVDFALMLRPQIPPVSEVPPGRQRRRRSYVDLVESRGGMGGTPMATLSGVPGQPTHSGGLRVLPQTPEGAAERPASRTRREAAMARWQSRPEKRS